MIVASCQILVLKIIFLLAPWRHIKMVAVKFQSSSITELHGGEWSASRSVRFTPRDTARAVGGLVGSGTGLCFRIEAFCVPAKNRNTIPRLSSQQAGRHTDYLVMNLFPGSPNWRRIGASRIYVSMQCFRNLVRKLVIYEAYRAFSLVALQMTVLWIVVP